MAASFGTSALYLVEEIENGYFDKLRATPVPRTAISLGRLSAEAVKTALMTVVILLLALPFGSPCSRASSASSCSSSLAAGWSVGYAGFLQFVALKTRSAAATNSASLIFFPLLFLTPNFVPRELLTPAMEAAATLNPVTYVMEAMRSVILTDLHWAKILPGFAVIAIFGAVALTALNVRMIRTYD